MNLAQSTWPILPNCSRAQAVSMAAEMDRLYGAVLPRTERKSACAYRRRNGQRRHAQFSVLYTPGHASHHVTFWDPQDGVAFVGDVGGISVEGDEFILPATPPPDIDIELWNQSLDKITALRPAKIISHAFRLLARSERTHRALSRTPRKVERTGENSARKRQTEEAAGREFVDAIAAETNYAVSPTEADHYIFNGGLYLSWLGLLRHAKKQKEKSQPAT